MSSKYFLFFVSDNLEARMKKGLLRILVKEKQPFRVTEKGTLGLRDFKLTYTATGPTTDKVICNTCAE